MTTLAKSLATYTDCEMALATALKRGPITLTFPSPQRAAVFSTRANRYRTMLREANAAKGLDFSSPYDNLIIRRPGTAEILRIERREIEFTMTDEEGKVLNPEAANPATTPPAYSPSDFSSFLDSFEATLEDSE